MAPQRPGPGLDRRAFLGAGLAAAVAGALGPWLGRSLALLGGGRLTSPARLPVWHAECSGYHRGDSLVVARGAARARVLVGHEVRLWCLCGGRYSERDLVGLLSRECGLASWQAEREVGAFLARLYEARCLVPVPAGSGRASAAHEIDCPAGLGDGLCPEATS